jgi:SRSO17 transposase
VAQAPWSDQAVLSRVREHVLPTIARDEPVQAWIIDDTGFPKKGSYSVGVARQYCGQLGKQENCQVAVSLSVATHQGSLPIAYRLYLPKDWADDPVRRAAAGVPEDVTIQTKPEIALQQLRQAVMDGVPPAVVLMDPAYGNDSKLRAGISELGLAYVAGILPTTMVWRPGEAPLPPVPRSGRGRPGTRLRRDETHHPVSAKTLALELAADAWQQITWRDGSNTPLTSRFARWRVRPAHDDAKRGELAAEEWLLVEWPEGEAEPDHYWLSTLAADIPFERLVDQTKLRWRIERDYLELKQEVGLGHYEGRGWRGSHHHASLCIAAYGFLVSEKETIPPSGPARAGRGARFALPTGYRPTGSAVALTTPHAEFHRHAACSPRTRPRSRPATMPLLRAVVAEAARAE